MADPPKPYDQLSLLFEVTRLGGFDKCAFFLPAGSITPNNGLLSSILERGAWYYTECMAVWDNEGRSYRGKDAIMCIAAQQMSIQNRAQITRIERRTGKHCQCRIHRQAHAAASMMKLYGTHPGEQDES